MLWAISFIKKHAIYIFYCQIGFLKEINLKIQNIPNKHIFKFFVKLYIF